MSEQPMATSRKRPSTVQQTLRRRARQQTLHAGVRLAADALFGFTRRANNAKALWSETASVWLGNATFLHWAMNDSDINIPWVVASAADAPQSARALRQAVRLELADYWAEQLAALPRASTGNWLPLP
jgi:hypothetical protein